MMPLSARRDLRDNYAKLRVALVGAGVSRPQEQPIGVSIAISDPGPISDSDFLVLAPGRTTSFEHNGGPYQLGDLAPGDYTATIEVTPEVGKPVLRSNVVTFRVIGP